MNSILGFTFEQGPEVAPPIRPDFTTGSDQVATWQEAWVRVIREAVQEHDAWAVLTQKPDGDVVLHDVKTFGSLNEAVSWGGRIWLLLAREARN